MQYNGLKDNPFYNLWLYLHYPISTTKQINVYKIDRKYCASILSIQEVHWSYHAPWLFWSAWFCCRDKKAKWPLGHLLA